MFYSKPYTSNFFRMTEYMFAVPFMLFYVYLMFLKE